MKKVPLQSTSPTFEDYPACEIAEACMKLVALILLLSSAGFTQEAKNPISNVLREMLPSRAKNTVGAIEEMPADKFNYRPTPEQMTFGHLAAHITDGNYRSVLSVGRVPADRWPYHARSPRFPINGYGRRFAQRTGDCRPVHVPGGERRWNCGRVRIASASKLGAAHCSSACPDWHRASGPQSFECRGCCSGLGLGVVWVRNHHSRSNRLQSLPNAGERDI